MGNKLDNIVDTENKIVNNSLGGVDFSYISININVITQLHYIQVLLLVVLLVVVLTSIFTTVEYCSSVDAILCIYYIYQKFNSTHLPHFSLTFHCDILVLKCSSILLDHLTKASGGI
jgi:hypothetical protein